jgi:hypothetical protein
MLAMSKRELSILLGAMLMIGFVPFVRSRKPMLTDDERKIMDNLEERILEHRDLVEAQLKDHPASSDQEVYLRIPVSHEEARLCAEVLKACLSECWDDPIDLDLHLNTRERSEVQRLLLKMESL